ncbi:hypothetical protein EVAR_80426_1 [Eumeta japonica]|uniref:Uncharacterized protein n=1 Tax=Eumeta variegata TaxID=151549 RepID=A0A4C1VIC4_EUMVA|nr:hypothetical protein EVAR_80426_1 [Eumeta japonica]
MEPGHGTLKALDDAIAPTTAEVGISKKKSLQEFYKSFVIRGYAKSLKSRASKEDYAFGPLSTRPLSFSEANPRSWLLHQTTTKKAAATCGGACADPGTEVLRRNYETLIKVTYILALPGRGVFVRQRDKGSPAPASFFPPLRERGSRRLVAPQ